MNKFSLVKDYFLGIYFLTRDYAIKILSEFKDHSALNLVALTHAEGSFTIPFSTRDKKGKLVDAVLIDLCTKMTLKPEALKSHSDYLTSQFEELDRENKWYNC